MAKENLNKAQIQAIADAQKINTEYYEKQIGLAKSLNDVEGQKLIKAQQIAENQKIINELTKEFYDGNVLVEKLLGDIKKEQVELKRVEENTNEALKKGIRHRQKSVDLARQLATEIKGAWKYLQEQDKIIKSTNISLGLSGTKAATMRDSFEKSAISIARIGGTLADTQAIMTGYAEETGRARALSASMAEDIAAIGLGTGLGVEQAAKLGAQYELIGYDATATLNHMQGVVETTERMGVNTTKVLKTVNDNFKRLNTYTFQQGVKGFAEMASYAEKFKIDITQALNAADVAHSLEGAVDLAAQLQVMGGEFAKTDPFEMLFLSRNDPAKFTEKIADMTKGVVSFRKMADGTFEKYISPADRDRLAAVAKSMGMEASALTEIAQRQAEIQKMRTQMQGMGLSASEKQIIEGAAIFNADTGKFQVKLGTTMRDISNLTKEQAGAFENQEELLKERAKQALTFDESFKVTINMLKSSLLPLLNHVNKALTWFSKGIDKLEELKLGWAGAAAMLFAGSVALKGASALISGSINLLGKGGGAIVSKMRGSTGGNKIVESLDGFSDKKVSKMNGLKQQRIGKGKGMSKAGTGVAAAGIGFGIKLAADGIGDLADSIKDLDVEKISKLNGTVAILGGTFAAILIPAMFALKAGGWQAALVLAAVGAAAVGVGFGIKLAADGIGNMASGLAELNKTGDGVGKKLMGAAVGVGAITAAMNPFGMAAMATFALSLKGIASQADDIEKVGIAFENIKAVLSGSKEDFLAVEKAIKSISGTNVKSGSYFAELSELLKKPLKVEFSEKGRLQLNNEITLDIDGEKFMRKVFNPVIAYEMMDNVKKGSRN